MLNGFTATFSNGVTTKPSRDVEYTHGWLAAGRLASGKPFSLHGFSISGEANARKQMVINTAHLRRTPGVTFEITEVVPVTRAGDGGVSPAAAPRDPDAVIDDLGFRAQRLEKIVIENIEQLQAIAARGGASADQLRQAAINLAVATHQKFASVQIDAAERMAAWTGAAPEVCAEILPFAPLAGETRPEAVSS